MSSIRAMLGEDTAIAKEIEALWHEYEEQKTPESHFVKDLDKLEMIIQVQPNASLCTGYPPQGDAIFLIADARVYTRRRESTRRSRASTSRSSLIRRGASSRPLWARPGQTRWRGAGTPPGSPSDRACAEEMDFRRWTLL